MLGVTDAVSEQALYARQPGDQPEREDGEAVLHLDAGSWSYGRGCDPGQSVVVVVVRLRHDLAKFYDNRRIWVEGHAVGCVPDHAPCRQLLVKTEALNKSGWATPR